MPTRIYCLAKELGCESKELIEICRIAGLTEKFNPLSSITDEEIEVVRSCLRSVEEATSPDDLRDVHNDFSAKFAQYQLRKREEDKQRATRTPKLFQRMLIAACNEYGWELTEGRVAITDSAYMRFRSSIDGVNATRKIRISDHSTSDYNDLAVSIVLDLGLANISSDETDSVYCGKCVKVVDGIAIYGRRGIEKRFSGNEYELAAEYIANSICGPQYFLLEERGNEPLKQQLDFSDFLRE